VDKEGKKGGTLSQEAKEGSQEAEASNRDEQG
jgi:hypothetical protein